MCIRDRSLTSSVALETNIPVDSQAFGELNDQYAKEMMAQQANTWYNNKYGGYKTGNAVAYKHAAGENAGAY